MTFRTYPHQRVTAAALTALTLTTAIPVLVPAAAGARSAPRSLQRPAPGRVAVRAPGRRCTPTRCLFIHLRGRRLSRGLARCLAALGFGLFGGIIGGVIGGATARGIAGAVLGGAAGQCLRIALGPSRDIPAVGSLA